MLYNKLQKCQRRDEFEIMVRILIVENNDAHAGPISAALRQLGYDTVRAVHASAAVALLGETSVQLIVASGNCGGLELTRELRDAGDVTPVILLTDDDSLSEKRHIFRSGADGYMVFPLDLEELQMRVRSLLWRCRVVDDATLRFGSCCLHANTLTLETPTGEIELRRLEFLLLEKLLSYPGRIFTRSQLMDELWGFDNQSDPRTVDTHIRRLRKKLRDVEDIRLLTVRGLGYRAAMPRRIRKAEHTRETSSLC